MTVSKKEGAHVFCCVGFWDAGDCEASRPLDGTASKKHQGTKSRLVVWRRVGVRYGDLTAA